jgi:hypothetical protein
VAAKKKATADAREAKEQSPKKKGAQRPLPPKAKKIAKKVVAKKVVQVEDVVVEPLLPTTSGRVRKMPARFNK